MGSTKEPGKRISGEELLHKLTLDAKQTVDEMDLSLSLMGYYMVALKLYHTVSRLEWGYCGFGEWGSMCTRIERLSIR